MEAIQTDPDALFNRGNQLDDEGRYDEAIEAYRQSASISGERGALLGWKPNLLKEQDLFFYVFLFIRKFKTWKWMRLHAGCQHCIASFWSTDWLRCFLQDVCLKTCCCRSSFIRGRGAKGIDRIGSLYCLRFAKSGPVSDTYHIVSSWNKYMSFNQNREYEDLDIRCTMWHIKDFTEVYHIKCLFLMYTAYQVNCCILWSG